MMPDKDRGELRPSMDQGQPGQEKAPGRLKTGRITLGMCATNCFYIYREGEEKAIFIDPADRGDYLYEQMRSKGLQVEVILLTHGHFDHFAGADELRTLSGAKIYALDKEKDLITDPEANVSYPFTGKSLTIRVDGYFKDGDVLEYGGKSCKVIATPGHTVGGCSFYFEEGHMLFSGDTLFAESVGRTDLPTGDMGQLLRAIQEKLYVLPEDTRVYPGHGPGTDIGHEKAYNPFVGEV